MRKLIILLFASALIFGCSQEAEEKTGEMVEEAATDNSINAPTLEPLPDWDSLPPIVEEIVEEAATDNSINAPTLEPLPDWDSLPPIVEEPKLEPLPDWDSLPPIVEEIVEEAATDNGMNVPKLEPLPDWDSLPPIVEEMASEDGTTMMEKAEEKTEETVDIAKDKVGEMMKKE